MHPTHLTTSNISNQCCSPRQKDADSGSQHCSDRNNTAVSTLQNARRRRNTHVVVGAGGGADDAGGAINGLHKLPDHEWHRLDALDLLLRPQQLALQVALLLFNVVLLQDAPSGWDLVSIQPGAERRGGGRGGGGLVAPNRAQHERSLCKTVRDTRGRTMRDEG